MRIRGLRGFHWNQIFDANDAALLHAASRSFYPKGNSQVGAAPDLLGMVGDERVLTFYQTGAQDARGIGERRAESREPRGQEAAGRGQRGLET